ncbi:uncharacterized protein LOC113868459 isoform X2 [Abrus precatorius]|uniref:Uncharacterized protein LOC113868459 isoform X2 n=1 Tax=Abrus precatorius TaxID=3816 RepID=A0A8B8LU06_ABRPR|nr:uncharacterized protein LOC113868459 isoform X2 [Abrus precatorius]
MDPFDDIAPVAPSRPGLKFMPKAKLKQLPRKEISVLDHATSSTTFSDRPQVEIPNSEDATNPKTKNSQQVSAKGHTVALVDDHLHSTIAASDIDQIFTNFPRSASEAGPVDFEVGSGTNIIPQTNLNTENELNNVTAPCTTCSIIDGTQEPPKNGEGSFLDSSKCLELVDNSLQVETDVGFKSDSDNKVAIFESNIQSKSNFGREQEVVSAEFELDPFSNVLPDPGARNARKFQPKIKPRPRVGNSAANASSSSNVMTEKSVELPNSCMNEFQSNGDGSDRLNQSTSLPLPSQILRTTDLPNKPDYMSPSIPFSEDNTGLAPVIPSQLDSLNAMLLEVATHNGTRDWPSSFGKSSGEAADIFSGLESLDDFLTQAASDTGKPALHSFNEKGTDENFVNHNCRSINSFGVCDTTQVQRCPMYQTTQDSITFNEAAVLNEDDTHTNNRRLETKEVVDLNPACPGDDVFEYQSMKSGTDPTSETPVHEELTNAADSPTLADFLHADVAREKDANERTKDGSISSSSRKNKRSSIIGEEDNDGNTSRQLRKQTAHKPTNSSLNDDVEDDDNLDANGDELEENGDDHEVDYSSKKGRASTSSKKKSGAKNGKTTQKRKRANDDLEKTIKEPPKKFSHSTQRRKRTVDKALLEIPEDELDPRTLPIKDIILLAEYRERLAKKEGTPQTTSTYQSGGDFLHEASANYEEEEIFGSEDGRDPDDDRANGRIPSASSLFNYQSFMEKAPRGKWSKQDTELFYEAVRQFGTDFSMIQQLFPDKTRHQIKLKYKKEERQHPLRLSDAVNNRAKDHSHFKLVIERLELASTKAEDDPSRDASDFMMGEEVTDLTPGTNEEVATTEQGADVKAQEDSAAVHSPEQSDDSDDDFQKWAQYKSAY